MELLDFFWPQWAQAAHLREIATALKSGGGRKTSPTRVAVDLQADINTLALVCMGLVAALIEKGVISELDLQMHLQKIDELDAQADHGLDPRLLRGALGLKQPPKKSLPSRAKLRKKAAKGGPVPAATKKAR
ncbi:MAG: hypothetical protein M5U25_18475 [Planctomycetota bacterium]|nr:hypothetical protein [Planctomycetota bacterium]